MPKFLSHYQNTSSSLIVLLTGVATIVGIGLLSFVDEHGMLLTPILGTIVIAFIFIKAIGRNEKYFPMAEIGFLYLIVIILYSLIPLLIYLAQGMNYTPYNDYRLFCYQPGPVEIAQYSSWYVIYLASFVVSYLHFCRGQLITSPISGVKDIEVGIAIVIYISYLLIAELLVNIFDISREYAQALSSTQDLELGSRQLILIFLGFKRLFELIVVAAMISNYQRYKVLLWIFVTLVACSTIFRIGARGDYIILFLSTMLLYHLNVRNLRKLEIAGALGFVLCLFTIFGAFRNMRLAGIEPSLAIGSYGLNNEFESCFSTGFDLFFRRNHGGLSEIPTQLYFADFLAICPQQFLPIEKVDGARWYMMRFFPGSSPDEGYGFGVMSEASIGLGCAEIVFKGIAVGLMFALIKVWFCKNRSSLASNIIYIYICATCFRTFRSSSFELVRTVLFYIVPPLLIYYTAIRVAGILKVPKSG